MTIIIDPDLLAYIDPLTEAESIALERSLLEEGCRDALVLWGDVLVDGHNRYRICQQHGIPFQTVQNTRFQTMEDVHLWMIDNHLGRRSVSDYQRGVLALRRKAILSARAPATAASAASSGVALHEEGSARDADGGRGHDGPAADDGAPPWDMTDDQVTGRATSPMSGSGASVASSARAPVTPLNRAELARAARVSTATLGHIEKIQKQADPALIGAVKSGVISINAAATVADLPAAQQAEAVAGGRRALRDTARQLREARKPVRVPEALPELPEDATPQQRDIHALTQQIAMLTAERDELKKKVQNLVVALAEARKHSPEA